jgi:hypothetical protein
MIRTKLLRAFIAVLGVAVTLAPSASGHLTGSDHRTNLNTWAKHGSLGADWIYGLRYGAVVWDHVWFQSHNFAQSETGYEVLHLGYHIDGKQGDILARTDWYHSTIEYDLGETWHRNVNVPSQSTSLDVWAVAAHENGHVLHLWDTWTCCSTMYGTITYSTDDSRRSLENYDREHIQSLYWCESCRGFE